MGGSLEVYESRYLHVAGDEGTDLRSPDIKDGVFYLDHSCDEWIIGDVVDALRLVEDILGRIKGGGIGSFDDAIRRFRNTKRKEG